MTRVFARISRLGILLGFTLLAACSAAAAPPEAAATPEADTTAALTQTPAPTPTRTDAPNLAGQTIEIIQFCDLSSDLAEFNNSRILAAAAMADHINDTGGVFGADLRIDLVDTNGDPDTAIEAYERTRRINPDLALVLICDAVTELALSEVLNRDDIPAITPGYTSSAIYAERSGMLFASGAPARDHFSYWLEFLARHWSPLKPQGQGDEIRLALLSWPEELGGGLLRDDAEQIADQYGIQIVLYQQVEAEANANLYDVVYAARDANANLIYSSMRGFGTAELLNALNALGLRERMLVAGPDFAFEAALDDYLLAPEFADASYLSASAGWWDASEDGFVHSQQGQNLAYLSSLTVVDIARHALEQALLEVDVEDLDAAVVLATLTEIEDYPVLGGLFILDYTGGRRSPLLLQVRQFEGGPESQSLIEDFSPIPPSGQ